MPSISKMRKMINSVHCYLDMHSNGELDKTIDNLQQFVNNMAQIAEELSISIGSAHSIVYEQLDYRKTCTRWVLRHKRV